MSNEHDWQAHLAALPHGPEFRFLDQILFLDPGKSARARFVLKEDADFLRGHFPGSPIMPGVLMIESLAQLAGVVAQCDPDQPPLDNLRLTAVRGAKILGTFGPGAEAEVSVTIAGRLGNLIQAKGHLTVEGQEIAYAQVTLSGDLASAT